MSILNCDDGLSSEIRKHTDLLFSEWPHLLPIHAKNTNNFILFKQRDHDERARSSNIRNRYRGWFPFKIAGIQTQIRYVPCLLGSLYDGDAIQMSRFENWFGRPLTCPILRRIVHSYHTKRSLFAFLLKYQRPEVCLANSCGVLKHFAEHGCQVSRRACNDLQELRSGSLARQAFSEIIEQLCMVDSDHGLGGEVRH